MRLLFAREFISFIARQVNRSTSIVMVLAILSGRRFLPAVFCCVVALSLRERVKELFVADLSNAVELKF
jgi:hypothetical protein